MDWLLFEMKIYKKWKMETDFFKKQVTTSKDHYFICIIKQSKYCMYMHVCIYFVYVYTNDHIYAQLDKDPVR